MKCIWCDLETTTDKKLVSNKIKYANKEHIFPQSVGGVNCLEVGKVCEDCNNRLGETVDKHLKTENFRMLKQYQDSSEITGKPVGKIRNKKDKERKIKEITNISGYGGEFRITRSGENLNINTFDNLPCDLDGDHEYNNKFSKALHKCAVNVLIHSYDLQYIKSNFSELIHFVNNPNCIDFHKWSYAACYSHLFSKIHFEPFGLPYGEVQDTPVVLVLIFPCAIFIVCSKPNLLNIDLLRSFVSNFPQTENWESYIKNFPNNLESNRKLFGDKVGFKLIKKEIEGKANPDDCFYMLTQCKTCGQTNPTGIMLEKESILKGDQSQRIGGNQNSWNKLSIKDLSKQGLIVEKWDEKSLQNYINQGVTYPIENDITKISIQNCIIRCLNCLELIKFDSKDCFI
jgi:HNH endonuclease